MFLKRRKRDHGRLSVTRREVDGPPQVGAIEPRQYYRSASNRKFTARKPTYAASRRLTLTLALSLPAADWPQIPRPSPRRSLGRDRARTGTGRRTAHRSRGRSTSARVGPGRSSRADELILFHRVGERRSGRRASTLRPGEGAVEVPPIRPGTAMTSASTTGRGRRRRSRASRSSPWGRTATCTRSSSPPARSSGTATCSPTTTRTRGSSASPVRPSWPTANCS